MDGLHKRSEVKLNLMPWFHGKITRDEAERLLQPAKVSRTSPIGAGTVQADCDQINYQMSNLRF